MGRLQLDACDVYEAHSSGYGTEIGSPPTPRKCLMRYLDWLKCHQRSGVLSPPRTPFVKAASGVMLSAITLLADGIV